MTNRVVLLASMLVALGWTSVRVQPIDATVALRHVCIEENPKVIVTDFLPVVRDGFDRHHVSTQVCTGDAPAGCDVILTYTALRSWDFAPYLSHAELHLKTRDGAQIASAEYHLAGKGGYSLMKWPDTKTKMDPVVDELLKAY